MNRIENPVSQDRLGLFDTPTERQDIRLGLLVVCLLSATLIAALPIREIEWAEIDAFVPVIDATMFVAELTIAALFYAQASVFRSRALTVLATGYIFTALLLVGHVLTFPGAFAPNGLLSAGVNTTAWIAAVRRVAFPATVILYVLFKHADRAQGSSARRAPGPFIVPILSAIALAAATVILATKGHDLLPTIFLDRRDANLNTLLIINVTTIGVTVTAMALLSRQRLSVLDLWLLVALAAWLAQSLLNLSLTARFTAGWYCLFLVMLASSLIVMVALIVESFRLYARLALSTAARNRERANRLMSLDALAATVSHEVGQPLSAVITNAMAAQSWLDRERPEGTMAMKALSGTIEAGQRTFDVIKSIRAMFAMGDARKTEFNLNDLARETIHIMDVELGGRKVKLELALDEALPSVFADRVQVQRVLINLLTNALEAIKTKRHHRRRITIKTMTVEDHFVQLEVSDSGVGIGPEEVEQIFEPFYTTKAAGTGLGLSLCRTIIEEHGGRLWASRRDEPGALIHLTLPTRLVVSGQGSMEIPAN